MTREYEKALMKCALCLSYEDDMDKEAESCYNVALALNENLNEEVDYSLTRLRLRKREVNLDEIVLRIQQSMKHCGTEMFKKEIYDGLDLRKLNPSQIKVYAYDDIEMSVKLGRYLESEIHLNDNPRLN